MIPLTTVFLVIFLCSSFSFLSPPPTRRLILDGPASSRLLQSSVGPSSLPTQYTSEATTTRVPAQRKLVFSSSEKCWHKQQKRHPLLKRAHSPEEETPASHVLGRHHRPKVRLQQLRWLTLHNPQSFVGPRTLLFFPSSILSDSFPSLFFPHLCFLFCFFLHLFLLPIPLCLPVDK